jgi:hypothetical protein
LASAPARRVQGFGCHGTAGELLMDADGDRHGGRVIHRNDRRNHAHGPYLPERGN